MFLRAIRGLKAFSQSSMSEGFALHEVIVDESGVPIDYTIMEVNPTSNLALLPTLDLAILGP